MNLLSYIKKFDWIILGAIIALVFLGVISIYSSSLITQDFTDLYKQLGFLGVSIILMVIVSFFDYRKLRENSTLIMLFYIISIGLLIGVLFMPTIRDTASWVPMVRKTIATKRKAITNAHTDAVIKDTATIMESSVPHGVRASATAKDIMQLSPLQLLLYRIGLIVCIFGLFFGISYIALAYFRKNA